MILPLEDQVVPLAEAKILKELGFKQDSGFWWVNHYDAVEDQKVWTLFYGRDDGDQANAHISAYTVAEMGEILSTEIIVKNCVWRFAYFKNANYNEWSFALESENRREVGFIGSESFIRSKMLIYLVQNKLIEVKHD